MNSGNRLFLSTLFTCAALAAAPQAGRVGEDGSGAMWIAPELVRAPPTAQECSQDTLGVQPTELTFETLDLAAEAASVETRTGVRFEWNPATGELGFTGAIPARVFADFEAVSLVGGRCNAAP